MSGRTYTQQADWFEVFKLLEAGSTKKASAVAGSIAQQQEEFLNRYVVTATDDSGSITFDAAGTYTFDGDVIVTGTLNVPDKTTANSWHVDSTGQMWSGATTYANGKFKVSAAGSVEVGGTLTMISGGLMRTGSSGHRVEIGNSASVFSGFTLYGMSLYSGYGNETQAGFAGVGLSGSATPYTWIGSPQTTGGLAYLELSSTHAGSSKAHLVADSLDVSSENLIVHLRSDSLGNLHQSGSYHYFSGISSGNYIYASSSQHNIYINSALEVSIGTTGTKFNTNGADSGVFVGQMFNSGTYSGIGTAGMTGSGATGSEYMIMSDGVNTFVSGGVGGQTRIRPGNNGASGEIRLDGTWAQINKPAFSGLPTASSSDFRLYVTSSGEVRKRSTAGL